MSTEQTQETRQRWYSGLTGYHWLVLLVASLGWAFDTMDQWLYVLARQPALAELLKASPGDAIVASKAGIVQALFIFGWATGGFVFGMIGDRWGRTRTMALTILIYAGFTGACAMSQTWGPFALFRFLCGFGVGGEFAAGAALVAEVFPAYARPTALGIMQAASAVGNMAAALINLTIGSSPNLGWRWVFGVGVIPALLTFAIRMFVKEPERWEQAKQTGASQLGRISELFSNLELRRNTVVGVGLAAVGVIGFWGIGTWSPDLLRNALNPHNLPELKQHMEKQVSLAVMCQNFGALFGILSWAWFAQRVGRKPAFAASFLCCLVIVPATFYFTSSFATAMIFYPLMGFATTSLFGGYAVYFPELYPTRLRATGTGFCYNVARYLALLGPYGFGQLRAIFDIRVAGAVVSVIFLLALFILPFAKETKDQPLPE
ncbi:MAG: MFS transporter [Armatimonadetes bacterium]|nr:MFS transporter [Armatimonadota bacterium]